TVAIDRHGATMRGDGAAWSLGLHATRLGRAGSMRGLDDAAPELRGHRASIERGAGVTEWFSREARGLEQGLDLATAPSGEGDLVLDVAVDGLTPIARGQVIDLRSADGRRALSYGELAVKDADGRVMSASMRVDGGAIELRVRDATARYPIVVDPLVIAVEQAQLLDPKGTAYDELGVSVAVLDAPGGAIAAVGSLGFPAFVDVFARTGSAWSFAQQLIDPNPTDDVGFGLSVALGLATGGPTLVVGSKSQPNGSLAAVGTAYVYTPSGSTWSQSQALVPSDPATLEYFGASVAFDGATIAVGAPNAGGTVGAVYVFAQSGTTWAQQQ
ncbi:MAG: FG-GAP repeat protein, partial [Polyangiales bacterium]